MRDNERVEQIRNRMIPNEYAADFTYLIRELDQVMDEKQMERLRTWARECPHVKHHEAHLAVKTLVPLVDEMMAEYIRSYEQLKHTYSEILARADEMRGKLRPSPCGVDGHHAVDWVNTRVGERRRIPVEGERRIYVELNGERRGVTGGTTSVDPEGGYSGREEAEGSPTARSMFFPARRTHDASGRCTRCAELNALHAAHEVELDVYARQIVALEAEIVRLKEYGRAKDETLASVCLSLLGFASRYGPTLQNWPHDIEGAFAEAKLTIDAAVRDAERRVRQAEHDVGCWQCFKFVHYGKNTPLERCDLGRELAGENAADSEAKGTNNETTAE